MKTLLTLILLCIVINVFAEDSIKCGTWKLVVDEDKVYISLNIDIEMINRDIEAYKKEFEEYVKNYKL